MAFDEGLAHRLREALADEVNRSCRLPLLLSLALLGCKGNGTSPGPSPSASAAASFHWPVPEGWKQETIPFPLEFAPDLPYRGVEELRFAPDFFEPGAPTYFSYAFAWWLEGRPELDAPRLERDLARYFSGLCGAVGGEKFTFDSSRFKAKLEPDKQPAALPIPGARPLQGTLDAYDPFKKGNGREISLNLRVAIGECPEAERQVVLVTASPRPRGDAIWKALAEREASFRCP